MDEVSLARFLSSAINAPLAIPMFLVLVPNWRYPMQTMCRIAAGVEALVAAIVLLIYQLFGLTLFSTWLVGSLPPVICAVFFLLATEIRDGRVTFLMATSALDIAMCDILTSVFLLRAQPNWLVAKVLIFLVQGVLIWRFLRPLLLEMLEANRIHWNRMGIIPLALCMALSSFFLSATNGGVTRANPFVSLLWCLLAVLIYVTLFQFQRATMEQAEAKQDALLLRSEIDFLQRQAAAAESANEQMRVFRHDMRHYISLLRSTLASEDKKAISDLLDSMEANTDAHSTPALPFGYTGDPLLDSVLAQSAERARRLNVDFQVQLTLPIRLAADRAELAVVVSNALENALNAAQQEPADKPRRVAVRGSLYGERLLLLFFNTFTGQVTLDEKTGLPRTHKPGHGYGTRSIAKFAQKHGCLADCAVKDGEFCLRILI